LFVQTDSSSFRSFHDSQCNSLLVVPAAHVRYVETSMPNLQCQTTHTHYAATTCVFVSKRAAAPSKKQRTKANVTFPSVRSSPNHDSIVCVFAVFKQAHWGFGTTRTSHHGTSTRHVCHITHHMMSLHNCSITYLGSPSVTSRTDLSDERSFVQHGLQHCDLEIVLK
jgi:hypothetical protein